MVSIKYVCQGTISSHTDGETAGMHIAFKMFQNLCFHFILSKENKPELLLELVMEYSSHRGDKSEDLSRNDIKSFSI